MNIGRRRSNGGEATTSQGYRSSQPEKPPLPSHASRPSTARGKMTNMNSQIPRKQSSSPRDLVEDTNDFKVGQPNEQVQVVQPHQTKTGGGITYPGQQQQGQQQRKRKQGSALTVPALKNSNAPSNKRHQKTYGTPRDQQRSNGSSRNHYHRQGNDNGLSGLAKAQQLQRETSPLTGYSRPREQQEKKPTFSNFESLRDSEAHSSHPSKNNATSVSTSNNRPRRQRQKQQVSRHEQEQRAKSSLLGNVTRNIKRGFQQMFTSPNSSQQEELSVEDDNDSTGAVKRPSGLAEVVVLSSDDEEEEEKDSKPAATSSTNPTIRGVTTTTTTQSDEDVAINVDTMAGFSLTRTAAGDTRKRLKSLGDDMRELEEWESTLRQHNQYCEPTQQQRQQQDQQNNVEDLTGEDQEEEDEDEDEDQENKEKKKGKSATLSFADAKYRRSTAKVAIDVTSDRDQIRSTEQTLKEKELWGKYDLVDTPEKNTVSKKTAARSKAGLLKGLFDDEQKDDIVSSSQEGDDGFLESRRTPAENKPKILTKKRKGKPIRQPGASLGVPASATTKQQTKKKRRNSSSDDDEAYSPSTANLHPNDRQPRHTRTTRSSTKARKSAQIQETIEIPDSDEEEDTGTRFQANRIAIGKKVFSNQCVLAVIPPSSSGSSEPPILNLMFQKKTTSKAKVTRNKTYSSDEGGEQESVMIPLNRHILRNFRSFMPSDAEEEENDAAVDSSNDNDEEVVYFVAFDINSDDCPAELQIFSSAYKPGSGKEGCEYIVVEFPTIDDVVGIHKLLRRDMSQKYRLDWPEAKRYGKSLLAAIEKDRKSLHRASRDKFLLGKADDEELLTYPFDADPEKIEKLAAPFKIAKDAPLAAGQIPGESEDSKQPAVPDSQDDCSGDMKKAHYVTIRVEDFERLAPGEWLNDTLVDFWMQWICRRCNLAESDIHIFTSHFFSALKKKEGEKAVESWTAKRNIDIFKKKMIFIPINKSLHWSLAVVINAGHIMKNREDGSVTDPFSCILFFDSLKVHAKSGVQTHVMKWLNHEWKRLGKHLSTKCEKPFTKTFFPILDPKAPQQTNGCDCGVFVCRYAYAMLRLRHNTFSWTEANANDPKNSFPELITGSEEFNFDMADIADFRDEIAMLVKGLSTYYEYWKKERTSKKNAKALVAFDSSFLSQESSVVAETPPVASLPQAVDQADVDLPTESTEAYPSEASSKDSIELSQGMNALSMKTEDTVPAEIDRDHAGGAQETVNTNEDALTAEL